MKGFLFALLVAASFAVPVAAQEKIPVILDSYVSQTGSNYANIRPEQLYVAALSGLQKYEDDLGIRVYDGREPDTQNLPYPRFKLSYEATQGIGYRHSNFSLILPYIGQLGTGSGNDVLGTELSLNGSIVFHGRTLCSENTAPAGQAMTVPRDSYTSWVTAYVGGSSYSYENQQQLAEAKIRRFVIACSVANLIDQLRGCRATMAARYREEGGQLATPRGAAPVEAIPNGTPAFGGPPQAAAPAGEYRYRTRLTNEQLKGARKATSLAVVGSAQVRAKGIRFRLVGNEAVYTLPFQCGADDEIWFQR